MKILLQCGILFAVCIAGNALGKWMGLPIPGNILGMGILFFLLYVGILKKHQIENVARFLLDNMAFFFVPSGVAILVYYEQLRSIMMPFLLIILSTTMVVLIVTGSCAQFLQTIREKLAEKVSKRPDNPKKFIIPVIYERGRD